MKLLSLIFLSTQVLGHSWLECTKYEGNLEDFEADKCLGRPRPLAGNRNVGGTFGADIGMDFRPQAGGARCQGDVSTGTPTKVTYEAGKTYTLAWAPKNHVAAECTNAFIPDNFLRVYMHPYNGATDPTQDQFKANQVKASFSDDPHVSGQIDYKGFQNCPKFCENTDKALCTGTITIPETATPGTYTFQWYWAFNSQTDLYATCWEADVAPNSGPDPGAPNTPVVESSSTTTTTTSTFSPEPCFNCCDRIETVALGTGSVINVPAIERGTVKYLDCPQGFDGKLKYQCLSDMTMSSQPRLIDGYCLPEPQSKVEDQDGTVAGLSVALAFTILAFCLYVACVNEWVTSKMVLDALAKPKSETAAGKSTVKFDSEDPPSAPPTRAHARSVVTTSNTELPVLPETPEWHYVNENDDTVGPVSTTDFKAWVHKVGVLTAEKTYVWNGTSVAEWTLLPQVPELFSKVKRVSVDME